MHFTLHDENTAPDESRPHLEATQKAFGMIPNLERVLAEAPPLLELYVHGEQLIEERTTLSDIEVHVVMQQANVENNCTYCVPWHTLLSRQAGVPDDVIQAQRNDAPLDDPKLETLRRFTRSLIHHRGHPPDEDIQAMRDVGYDHRRILEVVLCLAVKTISNYANGIAHTPLDETVQKHEWTQPMASGVEPNQ
ncbi:MAG: carboxymuconolactone decarboxylase family protein [Phycisphaeraceae bacterium]